MNENALRVRFQAEHDRQVRAFNHRDIGGFMAHYAPTLTVTQPDGSSLDRAGWEGFVKGLFPMVRRVLVHRHRVVSVRRDGQRALARIEEREAYGIVDTAGQFGPRGKPHRIEIDSAYEETWVPMRGGWRVDAGWLAGRCGEAGFGAATSRRKGLEAVQAAQSRRSMPARR